MRLGRRILDLLQAVTRAAPRTLAANLADVGRDSEMSRIERALAQAEARRRRVEENLAAAERSGQEEEARRARQQIEELARSTEGLRQTLDVIAARREVAARSSAAAPDAASRGLPEPEATGEDAATSADPHLEARKRRLSGPG